MYPELIEGFVTTFRRSTAESRAEQSPAAGDSDRLLRESERRIANPTEGLAKLGWSDVLGVKLREEEALPGGLKAKRATDTKRHAAPVVPHPTAIASYLMNLFTLLEPHPVRGREAPRMCGCRHQEPNRSKYSKSPSPAGRRGAAGGELNRPERADGTPLDYLHRESVALAFVFAHPVGGLGRLGDRSSSAVSPRHFEPPDRTGRGLPGRPRVTRCIFAFMSS